MIENSIEYSLINYTPEHWTLHTRRSSFNHQLSCTKQSTNFSMKKFLFQSLIVVTFESMTNKNTDFPSGEFSAVWTVARFVPTKIVFNFRRFQNRTRRFIVSLIYCWDECWPSSYVKICRQLLFNKSGLHGLN